MSRTGLMARSHRFVLCLAGTFVGFVATVAGGCHEECPETDCPIPIQLTSGRFSVHTEKRSFEEVKPPTSLPDLSAASLEIDAENKKVTLSYIDSRGESAEITFGQRAGGGGAGEGGS